MALVFVFILCCSTLLLIGECVLFFYRALGFPYQAARLAGGNISEMTVLCRMGRKTTTPSIRPYFIQHHTPDASDFAASMSRLSSADADTWPAGNGSDGDSNLI